VLGVGQDSAWALSLRTLSEAGARFFGRRAQIASPRAVLCARDTDRVSGTAHKLRRLNSVMESVENREHRAVGSDEVTTLAIPPALASDADECVDGAGTVRPAYRDVLEGWAASTRSMEAARATTQRHFTERGITFGSPNGKPAAIFPFDPIPRVIESDEWTFLERGLAQRAMALDAFVSDCYTSQRALRNGAVPAHLVYSSSGYLRDLVGVRPPRATWCHIAGIDVVRVNGSLHILEDNVRCPSGIVYALEARAAMTAAAPSLIATAGVRPLDEYPERLRRILERIAPRPWDTSIVVLTPGPYNAAYYEHRVLADHIGAAIATGSDLIVHEDEVWRRTPSGELARVDVIYSRVNAEWLDPLVFRPDSLLGAPGIIDAWRRGNVAIANAPGTGVADDKGIYPYVPAMVRYYLGEEPLIDNVPTYDLEDPAQLQHVLSSLDRMVLKPVDASGGYGIEFGHLLSAAQRDDLKGRICAAPRSWLAQEMVQLSKAVCLTEDGTFEARAVDLRPFVLIDERPWIVPGGLTRVAADTRTLVVNSSQGGGSKDTWVLQH
jgi:uncharacterized circularly permuted ATP-grasp superfamily protein